MGDQPVYAFHRSRLAGLQYESMTYQWLDRIRNHHRPRWRETRDPRCQIGGQPIHVVLCGVQIHQPPVHPHPDCDLNPKAALGLLRKPGHLSGDFQPRGHRAAHIVLMGCWVAEHRQQTIALRRADMSLIAIHNRKDPLAVAAHQHPVCLGLNPRRQGGRIHQIGEHDRQPSDLTTTRRGSEEVLGVRVPAVDRQHLFRQRIRIFTVTTIDGRHRSIQQLIDRRVPPMTAFAVARRAHPTVTHVNMVSSQVDARCDIEQPKFTARDRIHLVEDSYRPSRFVP